MNLKTIGLSLALAASTLFALPTTASASEAEHAAYCVKHNGVVQTRIPEYNTNGGQALVLGGKKEFCQFTKRDGSQINIFLETLSSAQPSLAALAYYAQVPLGNCNGNPGSCYCTLLGGTDLFGGINAAGGGWVLDTDPTDVLEACIFPDMSSIDSWGLAYHSANIIRGKDLARVMRYADPYTAHGNTGKKLPFPAGHPTNHI